MTAPAFTLIFLLFVALSFAFSSVLTLRHIAHIRANRAAVPVEFTESITLASHQKAADYTIEKNRLGLIESVFDLMLLLALTLGGGMFLIHQFVANWFSGPYALGLAIFAGLMIVSSILSTPFNLIRTFVIEHKFGFNKITWKLYLIDSIKGFALAAAIGVPLLLVTFWLMEKMGGLWWLYVWHVLPIPHHLSQ